MKTLTIPSFVKSEQDLFDRVTGVLGLFQTPKDIAQLPSPLISAIVIA